MHRENTTRRCPNVNGCSVYNLGFSFTRYFQISTNNGLFKRINSIEKFGRIVFTAIFCCVCKLFDFYSKICFLFRLAALIIDKRTNCILGQAEVKLKPKPKRSHNDECKQLRFQRCFQLDSNGSCYLKEIKVCTIG